MNLADTQPSLDTVKTIDLADGGVVEPVGDLVLVDGLLKEPRIRTVPLDHPLESKRFARTAFAYLPYGAARPATKKLFHLVAGHRQCVRRSHDRYLGID